MMKALTINRIAFLLVFISLIIKVNAQDKNIQATILKKNSLNYIDGPYVFYQNDKIRIININRHDEILETILDNIDSLLVQIPNQIPDHFYVKLKQENIKPPAEYEKPNKLFAVSDIEGNYYSFVNLLIGNKITDHNLNWIYGTGHLVLNGDLVDRGEYVTQVSWLLYKLEQEAAAAGGHVHFILGNHEIMNLEGNFKYVLDKYKRLALNLDIPEKDFYNENNEMGRWIRSKNIIEKIGDILFIHGGMSSTVLNKKMSIAEINQIAQSNYGIVLENDTTNVANLIYGRYGLLWYRGLVTEYRYYPKASNYEVTSFLNYYQSEKVVVGHTIVDDISKDYDGKVVRIDLHHPSGKSSKEESKALLIENGVLYKVNDKGEKVEL